MKGDFFLQADLIPISHNDYKGKEGEKTPRVFSMIVATIFSVATSRDLTVC